MTEKMTVRVINMQMRTDLAVEAREIAGDEISGVEQKEEVQGDMKVITTKIIDEGAARRLNKSCGNYVTIELPSLSDNIRHTDKRVPEIGRIIKGLLPVNGLILAVGLGNRNITPDALGPKTADGILATRHITGEIAKSTGLDKLRPVAVLKTGVTGETGIETAEMILSIVKRIKPTAVVTVDALAAKSLSRLGRTIQITDTGISPGAGVGNSRTAINQKTLGIPVVAIGIPTVVDAATLAIDIVKAKSEAQAAQLEREVTPEGNRMVVTPGEIDLLCRRGAKLLSMGLNCALQDRFSLEEIMEFL